ncbi:hypothetical protein [Pseudobacteroides cellulosolvens]|uniref:DUF4178 domain-containing protein n=1 Tax=Pseudobacteroides cellulosolvens ATCC 35603 = DSM 2933 TaxID=398512 RepID=A0A0L6JXV6_9FIRM|nr:hypothetical protein [Pseudobacteroides cellulosolvens]KNY30390.1 hypothetical protein Bccel_5670 [Pseudobacteroides cellulosolvens ATCC 35603 = DSM 2933]
MFGFNRSSVITKVYNPLQITPNSMVEFNVGELKNKGIFKFMKVIEMKVGERSYSRYVIYSKSENAEYVLEVFKDNNDALETYLYNMVDTIPFDEDFLYNVAGQKYLTSPDGEEYERCYMPEEDDRIDGISGRVRVYDVQSEEIEHEIGVKIWDYSRSIDDREEFLNVEMLEDTGMFRIFVGEMIEDIFYKVYQGE